MTIPYMTVTPNERFPRNSPEVKIDLARFAADIAKILGGTVITPEEGETNSHYYGVKIGADRLGLYANNYRQKIDASISAADVPHDLRNTYASDHKTESASVNPNGRTIERIAVDIKKRVIDASQPALALQRAYAAQKTGYRSQLADKVAEFAASEKVQTRKAETKNGQIRIRRNDLRERFLRGMREQRNMLADNDERALKPSSAEWKEYREVAAEVTEGYIRMFGLGAVPDAGRAKEA